MVNPSGIKPVIAKQVGHIFDQTGWQRGNYLSSLTDMSGLRGFFIFKFQASEKKWTEEEQVRGENKER